MEDSQIKTSDQIAEALRSAVLSISQVKPRSGWHTVVIGGQDKLDALLKADREESDRRMRVVESLKTALVTTKVEEVKKMAEFRKIAEERTKEALMEVIIKRDLIQAEERRAEREAEKQRAEREAEKQRAEREAEEQRAEREAEKQRAEREAEKQRAEREAEAQRQLQKSRNKIELMKAETRKAEIEAQAKREQQQAQIKIAEIEAQAKRELLECPVPDCEYACRDNATLKRHFQKFHAAEQPQEQSKKGR